VGDLERLDVFYDDRCRVCRASRAWVQTRDVERRIVFRPLDASSPGTDHVRRATELMVVRGSGAVHRGFAGWVVVLGALPRWRWAARLLGGPLTRRLGPALYTLVASLRYGATRRRDAAA
jgi:predicted DCC family thiol-disulfide oxidoreductase YuxK